jgi:phosphoglycolate phosphatase-like HAD superfamily hydrolase
MQLIDGILFEPVGCLAEFPSQQFVDIAAHLFGRRRKASRSGSRAYWHLLNLIHGAKKELDASERQLVEALELDAVAAAGVYEDVVPALSELKEMGVKLFIASSLSSAAITRFLEQYGLNELFSAVWNRDNAGGVKAAPLARAIGGASLPPEQMMFITDTLEGLKVSKSLGLQSILMMNDPDEARRLAMHNPAGGVVSLHELPDFIRLVAAENATRPGY